MTSSRRVHIVAAAGAAAVLLLLETSGHALQATARASREDALRLRRKVAAITERAAAPSARPLSTVVTEREVNAYLAYDAGADIPAGITSPSIVIHGARRVSGTALVDLDAVRANRKSGGLFDPLNYLTGKLPVAAAGLLDARDGVARFELESASVSGVTIPKMVLQELVAYYSRSPEYPRGINIDEPFPLPARIRQIEVRRGEALVVQ